MVYSLPTEVTAKLILALLNRVSGENKMKKKKVMYKGETDKRIIEKKLMGGEISEKELESYLKELPDLANNAEEIVIE